MSDRRSNEELVRRIGAAIADAAYVANEEGRQVLYSQLHRADEDTLELARRLEAAEAALWVVLECDETCPECQKEARRVLRAAERDRP